MTVTRHSHLETDVHVSWDTVGVWRWPVASRDAQTVPGRSAERLGTVWASRDGCQRVSGRACLGTGAAVSGDGSGVPRRSVASRDAQTVPGRSDERLGTVRPSWDGCQRVSGRARLGTGDDASRDGSGVPRHTLTSSGRVCLETPRTCLRMAGTSQDGYRCVSRDGSI